MFQLIKTDKISKARLGRIVTSHGEIDTPFFMPVGTNGSVKSLTTEDLYDIDTRIVLSNTYHLYLRPGLEVMNAAGGLHGFIGWDRLILTDSGGYQVFSLTKLRKISDEGVEFQSHMDGSKHFLTPEKVVEIQRVLGSDIMMQLDVCAPYPCDKEEAAKSVEQTLRWGQRAKSAFEESKKSRRHEQFQFGIIQGSSYKDLRERSIAGTLAIGFDGYAIGGVSVGEPVKEMFEVLDWVVHKLPTDQPRYFMGIGLPDQIVKAVGEGVDMFDTCIPTRYGRHGSAFTKKGKVVVRNGEFTKDPRPIDESCSCYVCKKYSRMYIRHLLNQGEIAGLRLVSYHNVYFYVNLLRQIRKAIKEDRYHEFAENFLREYTSELMV